MRMGEESQPTQRARPPESVLPLYRFFPCRGARRGGLRPSLATLFLDGSRRAILMSTARLVRNHGQWASLRSKAF